MIFINADTATNLQAIFDAYQGVTDLTVVLTPGETYLTRTISWTGSKTLRIIGNGATIKQQDNNNGTTIDIRDADNVFIVDCIFDGNMDNNEGTGAFLQVTGEGVNGNTDSVRVEGCYFRYCRNQAVTVTHSNGKYIRFVAVKNCRFYQCSSGGGANAEITCQIRGPIRHAAITDCEFEECSLVNAGVCCGFSAEVPYSDNWITNIVCANNTYYRSGTLVFVQKAKAATIANLAADETGVGTDGSLFNVNVMKLDDVGDGYVVINNIVSRTSAPRPSDPLNPNEVQHDIRVEETGSVSNYVYLSNVKISGGNSAISLDATNGGFRLTNCFCEGVLKLGGTAATPSIAVNCVATTLEAEPDHSAYGVVFIGCTGRPATISCPGVKFINCILSDFCDVAAPDVSFEGCVASPDIGATVRINNVNGTNCTVRNCDFRNNGLYYSVQCAVAGVVGLRIINNILEGTETGQLAVIDLNDPVSVYITGNTITDNSGRGAIRRGGTSNTLTGEITRNRGVKVMTNLPGPNASQFHIEENGHYESGTWIALPEQIVF